MDLKSENSFDEKYRKGNLFGRRKGKPLKGIQAELMQTFLPKLQINLDGQEQILPENLFQQHHHEIWLEIGFGSGEHLISLLKNNYNIGMIGCEPFISGMAKVVKAVKIEGLSDQIRLFDGDARILLEKLTANSISRVYLLYPDPWPKKRHWKRRFISQPNLELLAHVMKSGAELRFASDIDSYINWTLELVLKHKAFQWTGETVNDWKQPWNEWLSTRYEKKAIREGRIPTYLTFQRK